LHDDCIILLLSGLLSFLPFDVGIPNKCVSVFVRPKPRKILNLTKKKRKQKLKNHSLENDSQIVENFIYLTGFLQKSPSKLNIIGSQTFTRSGGLIKLKFEKLTWVL
jgi:hypothetical protein